MSHPAYRFARARAGALRPYLVPGRGLVAGLEREHLHLLLEGELVGRRRRRRARRRLGRQPPRARVSAGAGRAD